MRNLETQIVDRANQLWDCGSELIESLVKSHKSHFGECSCEYCILSRIKYNLKRRLSRLSRRYVICGDEYFPTIDDIQLLKTKLHEIKMRQAEAKNIKKILDF